MGSITIWVLLIDRYGGPGCDTTNAFVSVTIVISVISTLIALPDRVENGAILPTAVVIFQCTTICASAVLSVPMEDACAANHNYASVSGTSEALMRCAGISLTILSVGYMTMRSAESGSGGKSMVQGDLTGKGEAMLES